MKYYKANLQNSGSTGKEALNKKLNSFKLLICSPSNGGCDELTRRIINLRNKKNSSINPIEIKREFNIVRVGRNDNIHRDCEEVTLEVLYKKKFDELICKKQLEKSNSLKEHYNNLKNTEQIMRQKLKAFKNSNANEKAVNFF